MGLKLQISNGDVRKCLRIFRVCPLEEKKAKSHLFPLKMKGFHLSISFEGGKVYVTKIDGKTT